MFEEIVTNNEIKFNGLEKKIFKFVCSFGCLILKLILENYDKKLMKARDSKKYRHKGLRKNTIKTIMGEVEYKRAMYEISENGIKKLVYLLDEQLHINGKGKVSENLIEKVVEIVPITDSYRKSETVIKEMTNATLSFEWIRKLTLDVGDKIAEREKEERRLMSKGQLVAGLKQITALFEEADGLWINLQGKDRKIKLDKQKEKCNKENKEFNPKQKVKTELKLHVMYEGWKKHDKRHSLVNKQYIAGIMKPKEIKELRDARVFEQYDVDSIKLRVINGDGAKWTKGITAKGGIYPKDQFHIMQEIVRDVPKEYQNIIKELVDAKEYRNMGTQESQIFSKLKKRFCSGRKAFSEHGANALSKVCVLSEKFSLEDIETPIPIDTSVEDWIKEIEENIKKNKILKDSFLATETPCRESIGAHISYTENKLVKEILKYQEISELKLFF